MVVVDTSVWINLLKFKVNTEATALQILLRDTTDEVVVLSPVTYELYAGLRNTEDRLLLESVTSRAQFLEVGTTAEAIRAADRYAALRRRGITIRSSIDVLIASYCIDAGHELLARDRDFDHFERHFGLARYAPPSTP